MLDQVLSFFLGVAASFVVWWLTVHFWKPKVTFSLEMAEYVLPKGESFFQCAFENTGKRDIIDLEVQVRIGIKGYLGASGWAFHTVKSNASRIPVLSPQKQRRVRVYDTREATEFIDRPSKSLRDGIQSCRSLRDILLLGEDSSVRIHIFGYDSFSGVRKHFQSKAYSRHDIRKGTFKGLDVVENTRFKEDVSPGEV